MQAKASEPATRSIRVCPSADQVLDDLAYAGGVVAGEIRHRARRSRSADDHGREVQLLHFRDPRVLHPEVDKEHTVHVPLGPPAPQGHRLRLNVLDDLQHERHLASRQLGLDPRQQLGEERLVGQGPGRPGQGQAARSRAGRRQGAGGPVGLPTRLGGDGEDALAGGFGQARVAV